MSMKRKWLINEGRSVSDGNLVYSGFPKSLNEVKDEVRLASLRFEDWMLQNYGNEWRGWFNGLPAKGIKNFYEWFTKSPHLRPPRDWKDPRNPAHQSPDKDYGNQPQGGSPFGPVWELEGEGIMQGIDWLGGFFLPSVDPSSYPENAHDYQFGGTVPSSPPSGPPMTPKPGYE